MTAISQFKTFDFEKDLNENKQIPETFIIDLNIILNKNKKIINELNKTPLYIVSEIIESYILTYDFVSYEKNNTNFIFTYSIDTMNYGKINIDIKYSRTYIDDLPYKITVSTIKKLKYYHCFICKSFNNSEIMRVKYCCRFCVQSRYVDDNYYYNTVNNKCDICNNNIHRFYHKNYICQKHNITTNN